MFIFIWIAIKLDEIVREWHMSKSLTVLVPPDVKKNRACDFPKKRRTARATNRLDTGVNARGRALQQATMVTTLLKRRESSFVWYFRYIKPRICDSSAEFGLAKLHFTARGHIPGYINLPREHRDYARPPIDFLLHIARKSHASLSSFRRSTNV